MVVADATNQSEILVAVVSALPVQWFVALESFTIVAVACVCFCPKKRKPS